MKRQIAAITPQPLLALYRRIRQKLEERQNASRTPGEVFSRVYKNHRWGGSGADFCSGNGSADESIVRPYVDRIGNFLKTLPQKPVVVDLGCGDFTVGSHFMPHCLKYIAIDVVQDLVDHLERTQNRENVSFHCLDIVDAPLPDGDICLIRQVLQHLSNDEVIKVLSKIGKYPTVFITEHYPDDNPAIVFNKDKVHGSGIRLCDNSGVYLDKAPFNVFPQRMGMFLEVKSTGDPGVIRTWKLSGQGSVKLSNQKGQG